VKVSEEEMVLLTGDTDLLKGATSITKTGTNLVVIIRGEYGAFYYTKRYQGSFPAYKVPMIDTTRFGDAFLGAMLYRL